MVESTYTAFYCNAHVICWKCIVVMTIKEGSEIVSNRPGNSTLERLWGERLLNVMTIAKLQKPLLLKSPTSTHGCWLWPLHHLHPPPDDWGLRHNLSHPPDSLSGIGLSDTSLHWFEAYLVIANQSNSKHSTLNSHLSLVFLKSQFLVSYWSIPTALLLAICSKILPYNSTAL